MLAVECIAYVAVFVVAAAAVAWGVHIVVRPSLNADDVMRSAIALHELQAHGGRHRFHARLVELVVLASVVSSVIGVLLTLAAVPQRLSVPFVSGIAAVAWCLWWAWRRGSLQEGVHARDAHDR